MTRPKNPPGFNTTGRELPKDALLQARGRYGVWWTLMQFLDEPVYVARFDPYMLIYKLHGKASHTARCTGRSIEWSLLRMLPDSEKVLLRGTTGNRDQVLRLARDYLRNLMRVEL